MRKKEERKKRATIMEWCIYDGVGIGQDIHDTVFILPKARGHTRPRRLTDSAEMWVCSLPITYQYDVFTLLCGLKGGLELSLVCPAFHRASLSVYRLLPRRGEPSLVVLVDEKKKADEDKNVGTSMSDRRCIGEIMEDEHFFVIFVSAKTKFKSRRVN